MIRERVAEDVYVFTSELYAQVNAGAIIGPDWSVLIDTLAFPDETRAIKDYVETRLDSPIRYIINTHYHTDHTLGNSLFPGAVILAFELTRELMDTIGREAFDTAKQQNRELQDLEIRLPEAVFSTGSIFLRVGERTLKLLPLPGHSADGIGVLLMEDRVLFSGDIMMPIPYLADGDFEVMVETLRRIPELKLENLVQGHGDAVLRGEVENVVNGNLDYLSEIRKHVRQASRRKDWRSYLEKIDVEDCGKSRILMNGLAEELHWRNMVALYHHWYGE